MGLLSGRIPLRLRRPRHAAILFQAQGEAKPPDAKQPRKTWTNDNLSDAKALVSVVGDSKAGSKSKAHPASRPMRSMSASVRKQLEKLNAQMAGADKQIADLTNFSKGSLHITEAASSSA